MSFNIMGIGVGEGGSRLAMAMASSGVNIGALNTNAGDLAGLTKIVESKKLLLSISDGGSGKDPNFVWEAMKDASVRAKVVEFIQKLLASTPLYSKCPHCDNEDQVLDIEAIGTPHLCSFCNKEFGITEVKKNDSMKHNYIFLFVCLGGGSGSGLIIDMVDICTKNFNLPIAVVCTLPDNTEDTTTKVNAVSIFKELYNLYAKDGIVSPLILIDNQKMFETFNLPIGSMYPTINKSITNLIDKFNKFSNQSSKYMTTVDTMDTGRLLSLGGCCTMGKFIVGNPTSKEDKYSVVVPHPLDLDAIEEAMKNSTFVDGFDLASARGVGIIAVAPEHFLEDENVSTCIRYAFGKAKEIIGDGLVFRGQYTDNSKNYLEFYLIYNGLKYPEERFARMWTEIKEGKNLLRTKLDRIDEVPYDIKVESASVGNNFRKLQQLARPEDQPQPVFNVATYERKPEVPKRPCNNCYLDPISRRSTGVYRKGGPSPFTGKVCPVCQGKGKI